MLTFVYPEEIFYSEQTKLKGKAWKIQEKQPQNMSDIKRFFLNFNLKNSVISCVNGPCKSLRKFSIQLLIFSAQLFLETLKFTFILFALSKVKMRLAIQKSIKKPLASNWKS